MKTKFSFSHKILLAASMVVVAAFAGFAAFNINLQRSSTSEALSRSLSETGQATASGIAFMLNGRVNLVETVAQLLVGNTEASFINSMLEQKVYGDHFDLIYFGDEQGNYTKRPNLPLPPGYDARKRPWYIAAAKARQTILTDPFISASSGELGVTIATPVMRNGQFAGVAAGDLGLGTLVDLVTSLNVGGIGEAFLVNADGQILVSQDKDRVMKNMAEISPGASLKNTDGLQEIVLGGRQHLVSFTPIKGLPSVNWYLGLAVDKQKAFAAVNQSRNSAFWATVSAVLLVMLLLGGLINVLLQPLRELGRALNDIAVGEGDLTRRLVINTTDEFGQLAGAFNRFIDRIHQSIKEVAVTTNRLYETTAQVINASNASMERSDEQAQRTNSVAAAINELEAAAQEIACNAADASQKASEARTDSQQGQKSMKNAIESMSDLSLKIDASSDRIQELNGRTARIGQILEVIQGISQQTNLLALNAAIEAARAGEAGRGFAVVADEVRSLAHRTQTSAEEIQGMITDLQVGSKDAVNFMMESRESSDQGVMVVNDAGERLQVVIHRIGDIDAVNQSVAAATEEQTSVVAAINVDIIEINSLNEMNVRNLQGTLASCQILQQDADQLQNLVHRFRL